MAYGYLGFTFDGLDWQYADTGIILHIVQGLNEGPEVRGVDVTIPSLAGRVPRNRVADRRRLVLDGWVRGVGSTEEESRESFRANRDLLRDTFDPTADPAELLVTVEDGSQRTLDARTLNVIWNEIVPSLFAYVSIELESISPNWTVVGS